MRTQCFRPPLNALGSSTPSVVDIIIPAAQEGKLHTKLRNGLANKVKQSRPQRSIGAVTKLHGSYCIGPAGRVLDAKKTLDSLAFGRFVVWHLTCSCRLPGRLDFATQQVHRQSPQGAR
jgi:hypothetical protein